MLSVYVKNTIDRAIKTVTITVMIDNKFKDELWNDVPKKTAASNERTKHNMAYNKSLIDILIFRIFF